LSAIWDFGLVAIVQELGSHSSIPQHVFVHIGMTGALSLMGHQQAGSLLKDSATCTADDAEQIQQV
jgi:hypothetical protein